MTKPIPREVLLKAVKIIKQWHDWYRKWGHKDLYLWFNHAPIAHTTTISYGGNILFFAYCFICNRLCILNSVFYQTFNGRNKFSTLLCVLDAIYNNFLFNDIRINKILAKENIYSSKYSNHRRNIRPNA